MAYEADNESTQIREIEERITIIRDIQYEESESVGEENAVGPVYDRQGKFRNNINGIIGGGGGGGTSPPFVDSNALVKGSVDPTKLLRFEVDGFTTLTTRTITIPNATTTMAGLGVVSQTWTGTNIFVGPVAIRDTNFFIQDGVDITKQLNFSLGGATTGKVLILASNHTDNRTLTFPDATTSLAGLGVVSQTWTGTNVFAGNTTTRDTNFFIQQTSDITKQLKFDIAGATTGKVMTFKSDHTDNRTLTFPNATTTLAGLGVTPQQWTGTNDFFGLTSMQDINFSIYDDGDVTKIAKFQCSAISPGTTRTYTLPDDSAGLVTVNTVASFANKNMKDTTCPYVNTSDQTKKVLFDVSGITTATTRTWTFPDSTTTFAGLGVPSQSWTGTNDFFGITKVRDGTSFLQQNIADTTKQVKWDLSAITTATTRTITMPDADVTLGAGGGGANTALSNLASTAINSNLNLNSGIDIIPAVTGTSLLGTVSNAFNSLSLTNALNFGTGSIRKISLSGSNILIQSSTGNDIEFKENGTTFFICDGGTNEVIFARDVIFNNPVSLAGNALSSTAAITPVITTTHDIGTSSLLYRDIFFEKMIFDTNTQVTLSTAGVSIFANNTGDDIFLTADDTVFVQANASNSIGFFGTGTSSTKVTPASDTLANLYTALRAYNLIG